MAPPTTDSAPLPGFPGKNAEPNREPESLFERFAWIYAFFREHLFRDDTNGIAAALWPHGAPPEGSQLLELGCGPGFYCCRFAERFRQLCVIGVDRSRQQLRRARRSARRLHLDNCRFEQADALALSFPDNSVDALLAARLFTILPQRERAMLEMHRVLRPGGRCFIAEPVSRLRALVPLWIMWLIANVLAFCGDYRSRAYREPASATVLEPAAFGALMTAQPWRSVWRWQDAHYQYALCEKAGGADAPRLAAKSENEDYAI